MTLTLRLICQVQYIRVVCRLKSTDIVILRTFENFCERPEVDAERHGSVAAVLYETIYVHFYGDECYVGVVHCLEFLGGRAGLLAFLKKRYSGERTYKAFFIALKVGVCDELLDGCRASISSECIVFASIRVLHDAFAPSSSEGGGVAEPRQRRKGRTVEESLEDDGVGELSFEHRVAFFVSQWSSGTAAATLAMWRRDERWFGEQGNDGTRRRRDFCLCLSTRI